MNKLIYWWLSILSGLIFMFLVTLNIEIDLRKRQESDIKNLQTTIEKLEFTLSNSNKNDTIVLNINLDEHITKINKTKK
jgi:hypothetical protein